MSAAVLEMSGICFAYEDMPFALRDVSVAIHAGDRIAVLGGNGAGKSTFFLCCNGVLEPQQGSVILHGQALTRSKKDLLRLRERVGIVFQDPNQQLIGSTVETEVSFGPMNLRLSGAEVETRVDDALSAMNLTALRERPPHYLSGGEKKRLSIAGVLAMHPELILFDEPTASLDVENTAMLETVLHELHGQGKTLMVSTHDIDFAWSWASRILVFEEGALIADDAPPAIFSDDALLRRTGIRRPSLHTFTKMLAERGIVTGDAAYPRNLAELEALLNDGTPSRGYDDGGK